MDTIGGIHSIELLLEHQPERIIQLFVCEQRHDQKLQRLIAAAKQQGISVQNISAHKLEQLLPKINHQGIAAQCKAPKNLDEHDLIQLAEGTPNGLFLILDGVQDPHNLGACIRSADAAGVTAVIIPKDRAVSVNATVRKVACGAADFIPIIVVTNLARALKKLQNAGVFLVGLADDAAESLFQVNLQGSIGLVLGAEEQGMRRLTREHCDVLASLPMAGIVSSLNVSVATGISLFEAVRQRQNIYTTT
jgi:23S rRNA (guanosine2251-2'-O)-methyltransferase